MKNQDIKDLTINTFDKLSNDELITVIGTVRLMMLRNESVKSKTHFVCPITFDVKPLTSSKKIVTEHKETKTSVSTSYYYLSRKAFNKIKKHV